MSAPSPAPRVSVVMVCYDGADLLPQALESLRAQTFPDWELLFFDNGSTDGSAEIARAFDPRARVCGGPRRLVNGAARAAAVAEARGDYLAFLDHDDLWRPDKLERQLATLGADRAGFCYSDCWVIDEEGARLGRYLQRVRPHRGRVAGALLEENFVATVTVMMRASVYERAGAFDPRLGVPADYDLWLRAADVGTVAFDPEPLASYRVRPGSLTADFDRAYAEVDGLFERLTTESPSARSREVARGWAFHRWRWAVRGLLQGHGVAAVAGRLLSGWRASGGAGRALADGARFLWRLPRGLRVRMAMARARRGS